MSYLRSTSNFIGFLLLSLFAIVESIVKMFIPAKYRMKSIAGEVALVTGGGGGLGSIIALRLANLGAIVVIWDINKVALEETVKIVQAAGGTCYGYVCDLCDREDVYRKAALVKEQVGNVTILINNAGVAQPKKFMDTPDKFIIQTMNVNVMSHFWTAKAFLPSMMENNKGHIVSIASMAGHVGVRKLVDYCASKYAAVGFDEALRHELEHDGYDIHTTCICPYFIGSTGMFERVRLRYLSVLTANEVAERVVTALRCNEKTVLIPGFLHGLLAAKWLFPSSCFTMALSGLVEEVAPDTDEDTPVSNEKEASPIVLTKEQSGTNIHQQLTRRVSSSERKP